MRSGFPPLLGPLASIFAGPKPAAAVAPTVVAPALDPALPGFAATQNATDEAQRKKASTQTLANIMGAPPAAGSGPTATATTLG